MIMMKHSVNGGSKQSPTLPGKPVVSLDSPTGQAQQLQQSHHSRSKLGQIFSVGKSAAAPRKRIGSDDEILRRNRRTVDHYLRRMGALLGKEISLNETGMSYFSYKKFIIVAEVPVDHNNSLFLYTCVSKLSNTDNQNAVLRRAMELNYMEYYTRGSTLGISGDEINLCYCTPIQALTFPDLRAIFEAFMITASEIHEVLEAAKMEDIVHAFGPERTPP